MALTVPSVRSRRAAKMAPVEAATVPAAIPDIAIGDPSTPVGACPACGRPMIAGSGRCPGCGAYLLLGVPARKAGVFLVLGVVIGLMTGAAVASAVARAGGGGANPPGGLPAGAAASATPVPTAPARPVTPSTAPAGPPATAAAALSQTTTVDARLRASAALLRGQLASSATSAVDLAATLRSISADASLGSDLATRMVGWPAAAPLRSELQAFYDGLRDAALDGLSASITNAPAYRSAGQRMLALLGGLTAIDARVVAFAAAQGVALPSVAPASGAPPAVPPSGTP